MKKATTKNGNFAYEVSLWWGKISAIAYVRPNGELLSVKDGDLNLFNTWDISYVKKDLKLISQCEKYLAHFWARKIGSELNAGTACKVYDLGLMPEVYEYIFFVTYDEEGNEEDVDPTELFATFSLWGRDDVASWLVQQ